MQTVQLPTIMSLTPSKLCSIFKENLGMQEAKQEMLSGQCTHAGALNKKIAAAISAEGGRIDYVEVRDWD